MCFSRVLEASKVALKKKKKKKLSANAGDVRDAGSVPGSPGGGYDNPLQFFCLENSMDRGDQQAIVHRAA